MGGTACVIIINSLVRYEEVPKSHRQRVELEEQLRQCYSNPTIADAVAQEPNAKTLWETLEKEHLEATDLAVLLTGLHEYKYPP